MLRGGFWTFGSCFDRSASIFFTRSRRWCVAAVVRVLRCVSARECGRNAVRAPQTVDAGGPTQNLWESAGTTPAKMFGVDEHLTPEQPRGRRRSRPTR